MNSKLIAGASAIVLAVAGIAALFAPQELAATLTSAPAAGVVIVVQLFAAAILALAFANWMARGSRMGGIYNRPLVLANVTHFAIGALTLVRAVGAGTRQPVFVIAAVVYVVFAVAFALVLFRGDDAAGGG